MAAEVGKVDVVVNFTFDGEPIANDTMRVVNDIMRERMGHPAKGYTPEHDDAEGVGHLGIEAQHRLRDAAFAPDRAALRHDLVAAASLLVAAIEVIDRAAPHH